MSQPAYFAPSQAIIISIDKGNQTLSTTSASHGFQVGVYIRFFIPLQRGMQQLNGVIAPIIAVTADTFTVDINSRSFDDFVNSEPFPLNTYEQLAQAIPVAENAFTLNYAEKNNNTMLPYVYKQIFP